MWMNSWKPWQPREAENPRSISWFAEETGERTGFAKRVEAEDGTLLDDSSLGHEGQRDERSNGSTEEHVEK